MCYPVSSDSKPEEWVYYDHSSGTLSWKSDISVSAIFKSLLLNMVSISYLEDEDID